MTRALWYTCILILIKAFCSAQSLHSHPIALTPKKPETRPFNDSIFKAAVRERYKDKFRFESRLNEFAEGITYSAKELFNSNEIYTNLDEETEYVRKIVSRTIPREYLGNNIRVYIIRESYINAYCREDGSITVTIGLLAALDSEAELASILSHEFGHYYSRHALSGYKKYKNQVAIHAGLSLLPLGRYFAWISRAKYFHDLRKHEKQSDLFAVKFFRENEYASNAMIQAQQKLLQQRNIYKKRKGYHEGSSIFQTHPSSEKRISTLKKAIRNNHLGEGKNFKVDSVTFARLKRRAADECIYLDFATGELDDCIERAYINHIYYPHDDFYSYFLIEALRRKCSLFPGTREQQFITSRFRLKAKGSGLKKKESLSIHHHLSDVFGWEVLSQQRLPNGASAELLDPSHAEFTTNAEALAFFVKKAEQECAGCYATLKNMDRQFEKPERSEEKTEFEDLLYEQTFLTPGAYNNGGDEICFPVFLNYYYEGVRGKKPFATYDIFNSKWLSEGLQKHDNSEKPENSYCRQLVYSPQLEFRESYQVKCALRLITHKVIFDSYPGKTEIKKKMLFSSGSDVLKTRINFESDMPELMVIAKKYHFKKLYFLDITENYAKNQSASPVSVNVGTIYGALVYCIDFTTNSVSRHNYYFLPNSFPDISGSYGEIANAISEVFSKTNVSP